ncbi:MAG: AI-2E family transporter [Bacteroidota bacterium]|nr:AI-2E family transporter [Bacteroidota bacterium]
MPVFSENHQPFYFKTTMILIGIIAVGFLGILGKEVLCPLVFGLLFSILLLPAANFLERKAKLHRSAASALSVLMMLLAITAILYLVGAQISNITHDLPILKQQVTASLHNFQQWVSTKFHVDVDKQMAYVNSAASKIETASPKAIGATVLSLSSVLLFLVFIIFDTFFLLFYRRLLLKFLVDIFKEKNAPIVYDIVEKVQSIIRKYIIGLLLEMATVAIVCIGVFLLLGIKYAILLGLITALFNIIPYIGIFTALLINVVITFATSAIATKVLLVVITVVSMHLIDSNILLPLIVGSKVKINAFITLLGVVVGEMIWGIPGMFLSIPVIAILKIIFDRVEKLNAWGNLLGDDKKEKSAFKFKIPKRKIKYTLKE